MEGNAMQSFIQRYYAKCEACAVIGEVTPSADPEVRHRFAKPEFTEKIYSKFETCPDYIIAGLDGIVRREVTNEHILSFGYEAEQKVETILNKRLERALAATRRFKEEEEERRRERVIERRAKKNEERMKKFEGEQREEFIAILGREMGLTAIRLVEILLVQNRMTRQENARLLKENYKETWKAIQEEIKHYIEEFTYEYQLAGEAALHKMLDDLEYKFEEEYWDIAEWVVNKLRELEFETKEMVARAKQEGYDAAAEDALQRARDEAAERSRRAREDAMRRLGLGGSKGAVRDEDFDAEKQMALLEWRRDLIESLWNQLKIAEAERNQVETRVKEVCRGFKHFIRTFEEECDDSADATGKELKRLDGTVVLVSATATANTNVNDAVKDRGPKNDARIDPRIRPRHDGRIDARGLEAEVNYRPSGRMLMDPVPNKREGEGREPPKRLSYMKRRLAAIAARAAIPPYIPPRVKRVHDAFVATCRISGPFDRKLEDDEFIVDVLLKLNAVDDDWHDLLAGEGEGGDRGGGKDGGGGDGEGEGGKGEGEEGGEGEEEEDDGIRREFCLDVTERIEYRLDQANQRRLEAERRKRERDAVARMKWEEEEARRREEPNEEEIETFEAAMEMSEELGRVGVPGERWLVW